MYLDEGLTIGVEGILGGGGLFPGMLVLPDACFGAENVGGPGGG